MDAIDEILPALQAKAAERGYDALSHAERVVLDVTEVAHRELPPAGARVGSIVLDQAIGLIDLDRALLPPGVVAD